MDTSSQKRQKIVFWNVFTKTQYPSHLFSWRVVNQLLLGANQDPANIVQVPLLFGCQRILHPVRFFLVFMWVHRQEHNFQFVRLKKVEKSCFTVSRPHQLLQRAPLYPSEEPQSLWKCSGPIKRQLCLKQSHLLLWPCTKSDDLRCKFNSKIVPSSSSKFNRFPLKRCSIFLLFSFCIQRLHSTVR